MCSLIVRKIPIVKSVRRQKPHEPGVEENQRSAWMGLHFLQNSETWSRENIKIWKSVLSRIWTTWRQSGITRSTTSGERPGSTSPPEERPRLLQWWTSSWPQQTPRKRWRVSGCRQSADDPSQTTLWLQAPRCVRPTKANNLKCAWTTDHTILKVEIESRCGHRKTLLSCKVWLHELDPELSDEKRKKHRKQCQRFLPPALMSGKWHRIPKSISKIVKIYKGIMTQSKHPSSLRHGRSCRKSRPPSERKKQQSLQCKADYQKNGGIVQWNAIVTCATCTIKWPMARQQSRRDMVCNVMDHQSLRNIGWVHPNYREKASQ